MLKGALRTPGIDFNNLHCKAIIWWYYITMTIFKLVNEIEKHPTRNFC